MVGRAKDAADKIVLQAQGLAPWMTGDYHDSIQTQVDGNEVHVIATDWKALFIEFGTSTQPARAPLRRGAEAAGYTVEEGVAT